MSAIYSRTLLVAGLLGFHVFSIAQGLAEHEVFFQTRLVQYQDWLGEQGYGEVLKARTITVKPEKVALFLEIPYQSPDSVWTAWEQLRKAESRRGFLSLEQKLFYKWAFLSGLEGKQTEIRLLDSYDPERVPCFLAIRSEEEIQIVKDPCMSKLDSIAGIDISLLSDEFRVADTTLSTGRLRKLERRKVYYRIYKKLRKDFKRRHRNIDIIPANLEGEVLRFKVLHLQEEVLGRSLLPRYEMIEVILKYRNQGEAFQLFCEIEGMYGSRFFRPYESGYQPMEPDYEKELQTYTDTFLERFVLPHVVKSP